MLRTGFLAASILFCQIAHAAKKVDPLLLPATADYRENSACDPILPPHFDRMPHSQGESALCFAFSSADMISQRIGVAVSPLDLATTFFLASDRDMANVENVDVQHYLATHPDTLARIQEARGSIDVSHKNNPQRLHFIHMLEGGEEDVLAMLVNVQGLCPERDLPSEKAFHDYESFLQGARIRSAGARQEKICRRGLFGAPARLRDDQADFVNAEWLAHVASLCQRFKSPVALLPVTYRVAPNLVDLMKRRASGWRLPAAQGRTVMGMIDYALEHDRFPVIGYSYEALEGRDPGETDGDIDHSSAVVGRKKIKGVCHYMVQDDEAEACVNLYSKLHNRCILGRIWLTKPELLSTLHSVIYLR